jgi:hypothetical protein
MNELESPIHVESEAFDESLHPDAKAALAVIYGIVRVLELVQEAVVEDDVPDTLTQDHVDDFEAAFRVGERLLSHPDYDQFRTAGFDALPEAFAVEVYEAVAPYAAVFGVEVDAPDAVGEQHNTGGNR